MRKPALLALAVLLPLAACGRNDPPPAPDGAATAPAAQAETALGRKVQQALDEASRKLATENIDIGGRHGWSFGDRDSGERNLPRAQITPQGDLLIDGKTVPADARQRELLLEHRRNIVAVAQAGMAIGGRGADLGMKAAVGALRSVFSGGTDEFEKRIEAEGRRIEAEAVKLCAFLPALFASQQALAAAMPEFVPYATMERSDIEDCGKDDGDDGATPGDLARDPAAEADPARQQ